jgi:hypothetical protein
MSRVQLHRRGRLVFLVAVALQVVLVIHSMIWHHVVTDRFAWPSPVTLVGLAIFLPMPLIRWKVYRIYTAIVFILDGSTRFEMSVWAMFTLLTSESVVPVDWNLMGPLSANMLFESMVILGIGVSLLRSRSLKHFLDSRLQHWEILKTTLPPTRAT